MQFLEPRGQLVESFLEFRSIFRFFESADISVDWFVDPSYGTPVAEEPKRFTVLLIGDIINVEALPKVAR